MTRGQVQTWLAPTIQNALTAESSWSGNTSPSSGIYHSWSELTKVRQTFWKRSQKAIVDNHLKKPGEKLFSNPQFDSGPVQIFSASKIGFSSGDRFIDQVATGNRYFAEYQERSN